MAAGRADKSELRRALRATLAGIGPERLREWSASACEHLCSMDEFVRARVVMLYLAMPGELDVTGAIERALATGKRVCAPRVEWGWGAMRAMELRDLTRDVEGDPDGPAGLRRPRTGLAEVEVGEIDLAGVPGLGFDMRGGRLGRGGGFYDRFFASAGWRGARVGIGFAAQVVVEVPVAGHDARMDALVTESGVSRFA